MLDGLVPSSSLLTPYGGIDCFPPLDTNPMYHIYPQDAFVTGYTTYKSLFSHLILSKLLTLRSRSSIHSQPLLNLNLLGAIDSVSEILL